MQAEDLVPIAFALIGLVAAIGLLLVRIDPGRLEAMSRSMPGFSLFRFRAYCYFVAIACFALAGLGIAKWAGFLS